MSLPAKNRRWLASGQTQTLQIAVLLLYWNGVLGLLFGFRGATVFEAGFVLLILDLVGGYGMANERKWGYGIGVFAAIVPLVLLIFLAGWRSAGVFNVLFWIALLALLVHPQSRAYVKTWYR